MRKPKRIITNALLAAAAIGLMLLLASSARPIPEEPPVLSLYEVCVAGTIVPADLLRAIASAESDERDDAVGDGGLSRSRFQLYEKYHAYRAARYGEYDVNDPAQAGRIAALYIQETMRAFPGDEAMQITAYRWGIAGARRHGVDEWYVARVRGRI